MSAPRLTIGSLFSGIGGLELGLEWAGLGPVVWQVEQDEYCRQVLNKRWPHTISLHEDVTNVGYWPAQEGYFTSGNLQPVDIIAGGFPCQDISWAGFGAGLEGERSGLWREFYRIVRELRPRYVAIENVAALLHRGLAVILRDFARIGYDAEWSVVSACSVGAPHVRRRLFIVAYPHRIDGRPRVRNSTPRPIGTLPQVDHLSSARARWGARLANPSALYGGADGLPYGSQRNRAIGNAVVPQVAEIVGQVILERERQLTEGAA